MLQPVHHPGDDILVRFVDDELSLTEQNDIDRHVAGCATCSARADAIRRVLADVAADAVAETPAIAEGDAAALTLERRHRFESALRATAASPLPWPARASRALTGWQTQALAAAALIVAAFVVPVMLRGDLAPDPIEASAAALPNRSLTPGAVSTLTAAELCTGSRPSRLVTAETRDRVLRAYRMEQVHADEYELDALVTPELGGTTEPANLWPQRYASPLWTAHVKDELERLLPALVCRGEIDLARAQRDIATDWVATYQRHFNSSVPLNAHRGAPPVEQDELIVEARAAVAAPGRGAGLNGWPATGVLLVTLGR